MSDDLLKQHMENGTPNSRALYGRFVQILDEIGTYTTHPAKSTITFKGTRRGFCGAHPRKDRLIGYFDLTRAIEADPRIRSVSPYTQKLFVHQFRIASIEEMDETFQGWIREAYRVGQGDHLKKTPPNT
jgi:hypothetical protein